MAKITEGNEPVVEKNENEIALRETEGLSQGRSSVAASSATRRQWLRWFRSD